MKKLSCLATLLLFGLAGCDQATMNDVKGNRNLDDASAHLVFELDESGTSYVVKSHKDNPVNLVIPNQYNDLPVVGVKEKALYGCQSLQTLVISDNLDIGSQAFAFCYHLHKVTIGQVGTLPTNTFQRDFRLTEIVNHSGITLTDYVMTTGNNSHTLGQYVANIVDDEKDGGVFAKDDKGFITYTYSYKSTSSSEPEDKVLAVDYLGEEKNVQLPSGYSMGNGCFAYSTNVTSFTGSIVALYGFYGCNTLNKVSASLVQDFAFYDCYNLVQFKAPADLYLMGVALNITSGNNPYTFGGCGKLVEIIYPGTKYNIIAGDWKYGHIAQYAKQVIKNESDSKITEVEGDYYYDNIFLTTTNEVANTRTATSIYYYSDVSFGGDALYRTHCKELHIGADLLTVPTEYSSFGSAIQKFVVDENNTEFSSDDNGVLYNKDKTTIICYPKNNAAESFAIPASVTTVGENAFSGAPLTEITGGENVTLFEEGSMKCGIEQFVVSDTARYSGAFDDSTFVVKASEYPNYTFTDDCIIKNTTLIKYRGKAESFTTLQGVTVIGASAFSGNTTIKDLVISDEVISIGTYGCLNMKVEKLTIGKNVTSIGKYAFAGLTELLILNYNAEACTSVTTHRPTVGALRDYGPFTDSGSSLGLEVKIGSEVKSLPDYLFTDLVNIYDLFIPNNVETLGKYVFYYCSTLYRVVVGNQIKGTIPEGLFSGCANLKFICFEGAVTSIPNNAFTNTNVLNLLVVNSISLRSDSPLKSATMHTYDQTGQKNNSWRYDGDGYPMFNK